MAPSLSSRTQDARLSPLECPVGVLVLFLSIQSPQMVVPPVSSPGAERAANAGWRVDSTAMPACRFAIFWEHVLDGGAMMTLTFIALLLTSAASAVRWP